LESAAVCFLATVCIYSSLTVPRERLAANACREVVTES